MTQFFEGLILLVVFLLLLGGHWLPWRVAPGLVDARGDLKRVAAYVYGTACIVAGFAAWCAMQAQLGITVVRVWDALAWLVMDVIAAGAGTVTPRVFEWVLESQATKGDLEDMKHGKTRR